MNKNMIIIVGLILVAILAVRLWLGFFPVPMGLRHLINNAIAPRDLYQPIVMDDFKFYEKGFNKTYQLKPKYLDIYEIGLIGGEEGIESTYKFKGKLHVEFFCNKKPLYNRIITSWDNATYKSGDMTRFERIALHQFNVPLKDKYIDNIEIKITVLEPDMRITNSTQEKIYIAVSSIP
jgi:hypothetical protein